MEESKKLSKGAIVAIVLGGLAAIAVIVIALVSFLGDQGDDAVRGNTSGNIANFGLVVEYEDLVFYYKDGIMKTENGATKQIGQDAAWYLNAYDGYLYYSNLKDLTYIYRIKFDGTGREKLCDIGVETLLLVDGTLYFNNREDKGQDGIYRMNPDGTGLEKISEDRGKNLEVYKGRIYFINLDDKFRLYSMDMNGGDKKPVVSEGVSRFMFYDNRIYFGNASGVYRCNTSGGDMRQISDGRASMIQVAEGHIYYAYFNAMEETNESFLYRMDMNGGNLTQMSSEQIFGICYAKGDIYFQNMLRDFALMKMEALNDDPRFYINMPAGDSPLTASDEGEEEVA